MSPRKRLNPMDKMINQVMQNGIQSFSNGWAVAPLEPKKGRPKKVKALGLDNATITPVANGYIVSSTSTGNNVFVFETIDKALDFIKSKLKATVEQTEFLEKI